MMVFLCFFFAGKLHASNEFGRQVRKTIHVDDNDVLLPTSNGADWIVEIYDP